MKRTAPPILSEEGQQVLEQDRQVLRQLEDLSPATTRHSLSGLLHQYIFRDEAWWSEEQAERNVPPQVISPACSLSDEEEEAVVAVANVVGVHRNQTIITLLLRVGMGAQELGTLAHQQLHLDTTTRWISRYARYAEPGKVYNRTWRKFHGERSA